MFSYLTPRGFRVNKAAFLYFSVLQITGTQVVVKIVKNKLAPPFKTAQFDLEFGKGISRESEIIDLGLKHKFISKSAAFLQYNGRSYHGKDALKRFLSGNDSARDELITNLREKLLEPETKKESDSELADSASESVSGDSTEEESASAAEA